MNYMIDKFNENMVYWTYLCLLKYPLLLRVWHSHSHWVTPTGNTASATPTL